MNTIDHDRKSNSLIIAQEGGSGIHRDIWLHRQIGQSMDPTVRNGDFVGVLRISSFQYDGLYLLSAGFFEGEESFDVCRCQHVGGKRIHVYHDHHAFQEGSHLSADEFSRAVRGLVVMRCIIDDPAALGL